MVNRISFDSNQAVYEARELLIDLKNAVRREEGAAVELISKLSEEIVTEYKEELAHLFVETICLGQREAALALIEKLPVEALNIQSQRGMRLTALHHAIMLEEEAVALALVSRLPESILAIEDSEGRTPLHMAINRDLEKVMLALIKKLPVEALRRRPVGSNLNVRGVLHEVIKTEQYFNWIGQEERIKKIEAGIKALIEKLPLKQIGPFAVLDIEGEEPVASCFTWESRNIFHMLLDRGVRPLLIKYPPPVVPQSSVPSLQELCAEELGIAVVNAAHPWLLERRESNPLEIQND